MILTPGKIGNEVYFDIRSDSHVKRHEVGYKNTYAYPEKRRFEVSFLSPHQIPHLESYHGI